MSTASVRGSRNERRCGRVGWSGDAPRLWHVVGVLIAVFLLLMIIGNHVGHVEDYTLAVFAALILIVTGRDWYLRRRGRIH
jgi:hypothetical protein